MWGKAWCSRGFPFKIHQKRYVWEQDSAKIIACPCNCVRERERDRYEFLHFKGLKKRT